MEKDSRPQRFVEEILNRCLKDKGFAAQMRRADNASTEFFSYAILCSFGIDLERDEERLPYALIGASLSRSKAAHDGDLGLGEALLRSVTTQDQGEARLRRILACQTQQELCLILRPLLNFLLSRGVMLKYTQLLVELIAFRYEKARTRICLRWAQQFYHPQTINNKEEE